MSDELIPYDDYVVSISSALDVFIKLVDVFSAISREVERRRTVSANNMRQLELHIIAAKHFKASKYATELWRYNLDCIQECYARLEECDGYCQAGLSESVRQLSKMLDDNLRDMMNEMKGKSR
jgi:hypothetical protein